MSNVITGDRARQEAQCELQYFQYRGRHVRLYVWVESSGDCLVRVYPRRYGPPLLGHPFRVNLLDPVARVALLHELPPSVRADVAFLFRIVVDDVRWAQR